MGAVPRTLSAGSRRRAAALGTVAAAAALFVLGCPPVGGDDGDPGGGGADAGPAPYLADGGGGPGSDHGRGCEGRPDTAEPPPAPEGPVWCTPQPAAPVSDVAPDAFARLRALTADGCWLERIDRDTDGDGVIDDMDHFLAPEGALPRAFAYAWEAPAFPGAGMDDLWFAEARAQTAPGGGVALTVTARAWGSTARQRVERRHDDAGRLQREERWWNESLWYELDLAWDGDRLVAATYVDHVNPRDGEGPFVWTFAWTWDEADRLARGEVRGGRDADSVATVQWAYDEAGRPVRAERRLDGEPWLVQSWSFDEAGRLVARRTERTAAAWIHQLPIDDMRPAQVDAFGVDAAWVDALPRDGGACTRLPTALAHGYPGAEGVYDLGWPRDQRPPGIGFDYGYDGYAYGYGEQAWFGHGGVAGGDDLLAGRLAAESEVRYDARGRAVVERITARARTQDRPDGARLSQERTRVFDGDLLLEDVRTVGEGPDPRSSTLRFEYDYQGRLLTREYRVDDTLLARHTWGRERGGRDHEGRIPFHGIAHHGRDYGAFLGQEWSWEPIPPALGELEGPPPLRWLHEHVRSDDGRHVVLQKTDAATGHTQVYGEEERDAEGRLVARWRHGGRDVQQYDEAGRLALRGWDDAADGTLERFVRHVRDEGDRLFLRETFDADRGEHTVTRYVHACR